MHLTRKFDRRSSRKCSEKGYILITLMMMCSMIVIMLAVVLPQMSQQIRRDREMELIHRGVQYSRAIRRFYKKNGRYPVRLEELENSNNVRYLRQRYKDPTTGKDFKLLHFGEVQVGQAAGIAGGVAPGANALGAVPGPAGDSTDSQSAFGGPGRASTGASLNPRGALSNQSSDSPNPASSDNSGSSSSSFGTTNSASAASSFGASNSSSSPFANGANAAGLGSPQQSGFGGQVFGGGPIVGVASTSKKQSIREFNKKNHYNDWQFIYDPSSDRGGLLSTPAQPPLQGVPAQQNQQPAGVPVLTPGGQQQQGGFGQQGPGMNPPPSMTPQMPPDQQQAPQ
jgi:type II secretory pathway pseudopilin PulG